jgi:hypothetical protein
MNTPYRMQHPATGKMVELPSPTRVFDAVGISRPPLQWAANCAAESLYNAANTMTITESLEYAKKHWGDSSQWALDIGSAVHRAIGRHIRKGCTLDGQFRNAEANNCYNAFNSWVKTYKPVFVSSEQAVVNWREWYAGTLDAVVEIDGVRIVVDFKTSKKIDRHVYGMQVEAYRRALNEMLGHNNSELHCAESAILRLDKKTGEYEWYFGFDLSKKYAAWKALLEYYYLAANRRLENNERAEDA